MIQAAVKKARRPIAIDASPTTTSPSSRRSVAGARNLVGGRRWRCSDPGRGDAVGRTVVDNGAWSAPVESA